ncbi:hypothetical protein ABR330_03325 [Bacillus cabrialesii subsp. cabrialesii]|uniref:hypothetical protein n=1 Tax=Bacillus cabrialesii TaxID=2487276 RepID=UPI0033059555
MKHEMIPATSSINPHQKENLNLKEIESGLMTYLQEMGLPTQSVLVPVEHRINVFRNLPASLERLSNEGKSNSLYISKFVAAVTAGLFDSALNYLWDETINELRNRVIHYDINYFFDNAVKSQEKRKRLKDESDLDKIDDSELIYGSREIGLISELGFKHLDYIRYMRNWASAAHPNQNELTGLQLISWLETCINEVISLPLSNITIEIKKLLTNIKANTISEEEAKQIASFFQDFSKEQANNLAQGLFGIYTRHDTTVQVRENIHRLLPFLWGFVDEETRNLLGVKYGKFVANNDQDEQNNARSFLEVVNAESYIPDGLRATEIETALENLLSAHRGINNFYSEPPLARELKRLVGDSSQVPQQINTHYVNTLVEVFLTNGNGVAWDAETIYLELIRQFNANQALIAILSFDNEIISSRLQHTLCQKKFKELLEIVRVKVTSQAVLELINAIEAFNGPLDKIKKDSSFERKVNALKQIIQ